MKKLFLLFVSLFAFTALHAQWVNDPANNTFIANTSADAGEIYLATDPGSGDTYVQWSQFESNGWVPKVQRLNFAGEPQWDANGLQPAAQHTLASWSQGFAMVATTDNAMVSCFSTEEGQSVAVKINANGTYAWGEAGITLFNGAGGSRTELLAGDDGGVWALATDLTNTYLCYIDADGTTHPTITISDNGGKICTFGLMVPAPNGNVFVIYEKEQWAYTYFYEKDIRVVGYRKDGTQFSNDIELMEPLTFGGSYIHHVVPDGLGGSYVYIWHSATFDAFNTYVFHFNENGVSTISSTLGTPVHTGDPNNFYFDAYATVDPVSHDLLIAFQQTDAQFQNQCRIYVNRITATGERLWGEGMLVLDNGTTPCGGLRIDAFEDGSGFSVIYHKGISQASYESTVEAKGYDMNQTLKWTTQMCTNTYSKTGDDNSTGFHGGQNIVAWVNSTGAVTGGPGGLYGQNIQPDGSMGIVTPPQPPTGCPGPTNFRGEYVYDMEAMEFGVQLAWDQPENPVEVYRLTRKSKTTGEETVIEFNTQQPTYYDPSGVGRYRYQLQALYAELDCGFSEPATTADGADFITIEVTSVPENAEEAIVTVLNVYTLSGQRVQNKNLETLSKGVYLLEGLTADGKRIHRKIAITK